MNCLDIIKIKDYCKPNETGVFVEQYVDVSNRLFTQLANDSEVSGKAYAERLLQSAKEQVWADMQLANADGYNIKDMVYAYSGNCKFVEKYANHGIMIYNYFGSTHARMYITSVRFKPQETGAFTLVVYDGVNEVEYEVEGEAGIESTYTLDYSTKQKQVKLYAKDPSVKLAMLNCGGSGCGPCGTKSGKYIDIKGYNRTGFTSQPCGFIPEAHISCESDAVFCGVVKRHAPLFAKAIAFNVGILAYQRLLISPRLNDSTLNIDHEAVKVYINTLEAKKRELMFGSEKAYGNAASNGIIRIMQNTFRAMGDKCVECKGSFYSVSALI